MPYYVLDENKNRHEVDTSEGLMTQVAELIKGKVDNKNHAISFITEAQYHALEQAGQIEVNHYYVITDDTTIEDLITYYQQLEQRVTVLEERQYEGIEFYLEKNGVVETCYAKEAMTLGQWLISEYNIHDESAGYGFGFDGRFIKYDYDNTHICSDQAGVFKVPINRQLAGNEHFYVL